MRPRTHSMIESTDAHIPTHSEKEAVHNEYYKTYIAHVPHIVRIIKESYPALVIHNQEALSVTICTEALDLLITRKLDLDSSLLCKPLTEYQAQEIQAHIRGRMERVQDETPSVHTLILTYFQALQDYFFHMEQLIAKVEESISHRFTSLL